MLLVLPLAFPAGFLIPSMLLYKEELLVGPVYALSFVGIPYSCIFPTRSGFPYSFGTFFSLFSGGLLSCGSLYSIYRSLYMCIHFKRIPIYYI